jgi:histidinol-phosphatase (PHP family)
MDILKRYRELGGEIITVGSDAHKPEDIGSHFNDAAELLSACGFRYYCVFEKRVAEFIKL